MRSGDVVCSDHFGGWAVTKGSRRSVLRVALLAAAAFVALAPVAASAQQALPEKLIIGGVASKTGAGSVMGVAVETGLNMAVEEINANGGIAGKQVEVRIADTQSDPTAASNETKRLIFEAGAQMLIGPSVSQEALPSAVVSTQAKVIQLTTAGTLDLTPEVAPYHFAFQWSAQAQAIAMADYAVKVLGSKAPAILADNGGQSKSGVVALHERLKELGVNPVGEQEFPFRVDDMTPQVLSLRRAGADAVLFFASTIEDTTKVVTTTSDLSWDVPIVGQGSVAVYAAQVAAKLGPDALKNVVGEAYPGMTYCPSDAVGGSEYAKFLVRLKAYAPDVVDKVPNSMIAHYYAMAYILKTAIEATGTVDGPTLTAWIEENAAQIPVMHGVPGASKTSHFLFGPESVQMVTDPQILREDGLIARASC